MIILGAGLSGLIAATQFPKAAVFEAKSMDALSHKALLRFRTDRVATLTGIPFRKVKVRKSIWANGRHVQPDISLANNYSIKTNGTISDRSIWNLDAVERFIAPEDLQQQLIENIGNRITFNSKVSKEDLDAVSHKPVISTIPMPAMIKTLGLEEQIPNDMFSYAQIKVDRYRINDCDVHQTIYFPCMDDGGLYRASITGDLLIIESNSNLSYKLRRVTEAFGIHPSDLIEVELGHLQKYGKIVPIEDFLRKQFIFDLTKNRNIYSLGRFAIWKNVLLDDVVQDSFVIKDLIKNGNYQAAIHNAKERS